MKVLKRHIEKDGCGYIKMKAEESEDMWHAYNLISIGDYVRTTTIRKVVNESATGSTTSRRVRLNLKIAVERTDFDSEGCILRLSGRNIEENTHVKKGAYHTLDLDLNNDFSIEKQNWDIIHLDRIEEASNPVKKADVAAVVMTAGLAHICLITSHLTITRARIEMNIPRKRAGSSDHSKAMRRFYEAVYRAILEKIDFTVIKCVLLGSPGFVKDDYFEYQSIEAIRREDKPFIENKSKFILCNCSSGHKNAVEELLSQPAVLAKLADTKAAAEVKILQDFFNMLKSDSDRAFYGYNHVFRACSDSAIDSLLVSDSLFRSRDLATRRKYVNLVEKSREIGAHIFVFSSMHVTGEQLEKLSGIAALLRFPLPDVEVESDEESQGSVHLNEEEDLSSKVSAIDFGF